MLRMTARSRVLRELKLLEEESPNDGLNIILTDDICLLYADISVFGNPLYPPEDKYRLKIMIPEKYPFTYPICQFIIDTSQNITKIPIHPHIYSNGHICLDIFGPAWAPVYRIESLLIAIQSILACNDTAERPKLNGAFVERAPKDPSKTRWDYHDDNV